MAPGEELRSFLRSVNRSKTPKVKTKLGARQKAEGESPSHGDNAINIPLPSSVFDVAPLCFLAPFRLLIPNLIL